MVWDGGIATDDSREERRGGLTGLVSADGVSAGDSLPIGIVEVVGVARQLVDGLASRLRDTPLPVPVSADVGAEHVLVINSRSVGIDNVHADLVSGRPACLGGSRYGCREGDVGDAQRCKILRGDGVGHSRPLKPWLLTSQRGCDLIVFVTVVVENGNLCSVVGRERLRNQ